MCGEMHDAVLGEPPAGAQALHLASRWPARRGGCRWIGVQVASHRAQFIRRLGQRSRTAHKGASAKPPRVG